MELAFKTKSLRRVCESQDNARRALGVEVAEQLKRRLADLRVVDSLDELPAVLPRELKGGRRMVIDLCQGFYVIIVPNHRTVPVLNTGKVDWSNVRRIQLVKIESSHG